jgi:SAM-dependent methyltransferase
VGAESYGGRRPIIGALHEYDLIADWYAAQRTDATGVPELTELLSTLPPNASVLDVGCGNGLPMTRLLIDHGCQVLGVDSSPKMLQYFAKNFPAVPTICAPIQDCDLNGRSFDAAHMWGVMYFLPHAEQVRAIAKVASVLKPGGSFLFTSGDDEGWKDGEPMNGVPFRYYSFTKDGYRDLLREHGLTLQKTHVDKGDNMYYLARKA